MNTKTFPNHSIVVKANVGMRIFVANRSTTRGRMKVYNSVNRTLTLTPSHHVSCAQCKEHG